MPPNEDPLGRIPAKNAKSIRFLTFNVNGCKTLFKYHPWTSLQNSYDKFLSCLDADIVTLQELKIQQDSVSPLGLVEDYRAFISIPKSKKGYSGVALYVRRPRSQDTAAVRRFLTVVRAEEGITGRLRSGNGGKTPYFRLSDNIGGYADENDMAELDIDEEHLAALDSEGRCAVVELATNTVIFALYCPANSSGTEEGQVFRLQFLQVLLRRCARLRQLGKHVVIMGDINVSMDLIDNAEGINERIKQKIVVNNLSDGPDQFETRNIDECLAFRTSAPQRELLNMYTVPTLSSAPVLESQFLYDTTRLVQKRRLAMYTVWNTLTSARQSNYGSRIDLILASSAEFAQNLTAADILPFLHGSDHCPVFTDVDVSYDQTERNEEEVKLPFEARAFYKLVKHRDISSMFSSRPVSASATPPPEKKRKLEYTSRKKTDSQQLIRNFFFEEGGKKGKSGIGEKKEESERGEGNKRRENEQDDKVGNEKGSDNEVIGVTELVGDSQSTTDKENLFVMEDITKEGNTNIQIPNPDEIVTKTAHPKKPVQLRSIEAFASLVYSDPPYCRHGERCCLKTSLTKDNRGRKFWCCARASKGNSGELGEHRCEFFEWAKVNH